MRTRNFQPVRYTNNRYTVTGMLAVAAVMGMMVCRKAGAANDELELANGKAGWILDRDVLANKAALTNAIEANELRPDKDYFEYPYVAGQPVTGQDFEEFWVEGDALGAGMDATVAAETQLTTAAGKYVPLTDSEAQECVGIVKQNIAAVNTDAPARRFLIETRRAPKNILPS
jgi:hypothetical protein